MNIGYGKTMSSKVAVFWLGNAGKLCHNIPHAFPSPPLNICFVTGTRAEFGLMKPVLEAIQARAELRLSIVATGMHLDRRRGSYFG